ncbi:hypothetical protein CB467_21385 [Salmonella enterica subsp. enterica serovar Goverdhan]|nr:hypothetical protein [Salmonella enterica subsp. enterica serovar Goverdhan]
MAAVLGIDPGCSGSLVLITEQGGYIDHLAMPTIKVGTKSRVNGAAVAAWIRRYGISHAYLEQVGAMPGQGTASMFTFGHAAGVAEGILQGLNIPYTLVTPQAWKKSAGLTVAECVIDKLCPSHTVVVFAYPEGKENAQN